MQQLIIESIIVFLIINILEFLFMCIFDVKNNIKASFILNNIFGISLFCVMYYLKIFIKIYTLKEIIIVSSTGTFGLIYILISLIIY